MTRTKADKFLMHPWFRRGMRQSLPTRWTPLAWIRPRSSREPSQALRKQDANYYPILIESGIVSAMDSNGTLVISLSCDYAIGGTCGPPGEDLTQFAQSRSEIKGLSLWWMGKFPIARPGIEDSHDRCSRRRAGEAMKRGAAL